jgi:hypothetical protein
MITMLLIDIEKHIKPLSRADKEQLIRDVQRMLDEEEMSDDERLLQERIPPGTSIPIDSPGAFVDDTMYKAATQLQQFIQEHEHEV